MRPTRRDLLAAATAGVAGLAGCLGPGGGDDGTPAENPPDGPVANAPVPDAPGEQTYATMGASSAPLVTYFGNWKCPVCAEFSTGSDRVFDLGRIVTDYVEPGDLALRFRGLAYVDGEPFLGPDAPRAARAGLAVWNVDPDSYWSYHEHVFAHQPPESKRWATVDRLAEFAHLAGVEDVAAIRESIEGGEYEQSVRATSDAAASAGIDATPLLLVGDRVVSPFEPDETKQALDALADGS